MGFKNPAGLSFVVVLAGLLAACGSNNSGPSSNSNNVSPAGVPVVSPSAAAVLPGQSMKFTATENGSPVADPLWEVNGVAGGSQATGTISSAGMYTAPSSSTTTTFTITVADPASRSLSAPATISIFNPKTFTPGTVSATSNPLVAAYTLAAPLGATVTVQFGPDQNYGLSTSAQPSTGAGTTVFVAGMRTNTTYHMQAILQLSNGATFSDTDHIFTTGTIPADLLPNITVQNFGIGSLSPGIEFLCLAPASGSPKLTAVVTDLDGNIIWYYDIGSGLWPEPMKLLPNGHILVVAAPTPNAEGEIPPGSINEVREIDLAGDVLTRITIPEIENSLEALGVPNQVYSLHHDILRLPNGHTIILYNYNVKGVLGDALVDWDPQLGAVWRWSTFDHLSQSHAPYGIADWTHSNAIIYSPTDGNLILSMRNQNWIIKINYQDGKGDGSILWRFGFGGDFSLPPGQAPIEWNYGQHYVNVVGSPSAGIFTLMFFNNGNNRLMNSADTVCGSPNVPNCYSSVPIFQVNESTKEATVLWEDKLTYAYSICCGNATVLPNNDVEFDVAYSVFTPGVSYAQEVTQTQNPQILWQLNEAGQIGYRIFRVPSLYPGVIWAQPALTSTSGSAPVKPSGEH